MNESALIASVKAIRESKGDFNSELANIQLQDAGYQMFCALRYALYDLTWADLTKEEKVTAAEVTIQQFGDTFMAYFPAFLDLLAEMYGGMEMMSAKKLIEEKAGRMISAANEKTIQTHCSSIKDSADALLALVASAEDTSKEAVDPEAKAAPKSEPVPHSALGSQIKALKGLYGTAPAA